jgi:hypothetical protein
MAPVLASCFGWFKSSNANGKRDATEYNVSCTKRPESCHSRDRQESVHVRRMYGLGYVHVTVSAETPETGGGPSRSSTVFLPVGKMYSVVSLAELCRWRLKAAEVN